MNVTRKAKGAEPYYWLRSSLDCAQIAYYGMFGSPGSAMGAGNDIPLTTPVSPP